MWSVNEAGFEFLKKDDLPEEVFAFSLLEDLSREGKAELLTDNQYLIKHEEIVRLNEETKRALKLPGIFRLPIQLKVKGTLTSNNLEYQYRFMKTQYEPFVAPKLTGSYLYISSSEEYLLSEIQYRLIMEIDQFNSRSKDKSGVSMMQNNYMHFAKIKELSYETGVLLDGYLQGENVMTPGDITVDIIPQEDMSIVVKPVFKGMENATEVFADNFASKNVNPVQNLPNRGKLVLTSEQVDGLKELQEYSHLSGEAKRAFLQAPHNFVNSPAINFEGFASRVIDIGLYTPRTIPFLTPVKNDWLGTENAQNEIAEQIKEAGLFVDGKKIIIAQQDYDGLIKELSKAIDCESEFVEYNGNKIPATKEALENLNKIQQAFKSKKTQDKVDDKVSKDHEILIIDDNVEENSYVQARVLRPQVATSFNGATADTKLFEHQIEGFQFLQKCWLAGDRGALLADDMGLGKTIQALFFLGWLRSLMNESVIEDKPMLIVGPVALLKNWENEYERFLKMDLFGQCLSLHGTDLKAFRGNGFTFEYDQKISALAEKLKNENKFLDINKLKKYRLVLTTYETLRDYQLSFGMIDWGVVVLDEAQRIKTPTAFVSMAAKAMKYDFGLAMTGTPVENSWIDLWSIIDFCQPGRLGSLQSFAEEFHKPLRQEETDRVLLGHKLKQQVEPLLLRRNKEEVIDGLPEKIIHHIPVPMPPMQANAYQNILARGRKQLADDGSGENIEHILQIIQKLRLVSLHPMLIQNEQSLFKTPIEKLIEVSARLKAAISILKEIQKKKEKALVFVRDRKMQRIFRKIVEQYFAIKCLGTINGEVAGVKRQDTIDEFNALEGFQILILSPEAGGVGLNITSANHVIHLSREWNPAKEDQATDRSYRIGQTRDVHVYLPLAIHPALGDGGSFDKKLDLLLERKRSLSRDILYPTDLMDNEQKQHFVGLIEDTNAEEIVSKIFTIEDSDTLEQESFTELLEKIYLRQGYQILKNVNRKGFNADICAVNEKEKSILIMQCKHSIDKDKILAVGGVQEVIAFQPDYRKAFPKYNMLLSVCSNCEKFEDDARALANTKHVKLIGRQDLHLLLEEAKIDYNEGMWSD